MNNDLSKLQDAIKERLRIESNLYLTEKEKLESVTDNGIIKTSLLEEPYALIALTGASLAFDKFKKIAYPVIFKNLAFRLLIANTIYYLVFTDYSRFYKRIYKKLILNYK
jgi:hypothetical protein